MTNREKMRQSIINIFNAYKDWSDDELARNMSLKVRHVKCIEELPVS